MITEIKNIRVELDKQTIIMQGLKPSREISVAITASQNAKMWMGMALKELEVENPYPESKNAANDKIEPTADVYKGDLNLSSQPHINQVKQLRFDLTAIADGLESNKGNLLSTNIDVQLYHHLLKAWEYTIESNMWLGMELGRIFKETQ